MVTHNICFHVEIRKHLCEYAILSGTVVFSGSTGKPKGVLHTQGGYMMYSSTTFKYVFDYQAEDDIYWCTADVGWITGHSYVSYGPLVNGATSVIVSI